MAAHRAEQPPPPWQRWKGSQGRIVSVHANVFKISWNDTEGQCIYEYDVMTKSLASRTEEESKISKSKARELMQRLQVELYPDIFQVQGAYDGSKIIWSTSQLPLPGGAVGEFTLPWSRPDPQHPVRAPMMVNVKITFAKQVEKRYLNSVVLGMGAANLLTGEPFAHEDATTALNALNVIFQQAPSVGGAVRNGRRIFVASQRDARRLGPFLMVQGYFQSVRPIPRGLMVNIDVITGLLIGQEDLAGFAADYLGIGRNQLRDINAQNYQKLRYALKGLRIETTMSTRRRTYRISDLVRRAGRVQFDKGTTKITVAEHFLQAHNVHIRDPDLFGVQIGRKDHGITLPIEICKIVTPQLWNKQPPSRIQSDIVKHSAKPPQGRMADIKHARTALAYDSSVTLAGGGLSVDQELSRVQGRLLDAPQLQFGGQSTMTFPPNNIGVWNVTQQQLAEPSSVGSWAIIDLASSNRDLVYRFANELMKVMKDRGMHVEGNPVLGQLTSPSIETVGEHLFGLPSKPDLVVFILPQNSPDIYRMVKRLGDIVIPGGLVTQCVTAGKNYNNQYCNNLALKINVKLGGVNSFVRSPTMNQLKGQGVMALGADVSHPTDLSQPSVAALVSSWDDTCTKYVASIRIQRPRQEVIEDMEAMVERALRCYFDAHQGQQRKLPRTLLFYRDGVSEGEYRTLAITEVAAIKAAIAKAYGPNMAGWPGLVFVIVGKRHHIRFFPEQRDADRTGNCRSGLVVDQEIGHPTEFNYYLQSQPGLKGTSRPSHYVAIINTPGISADILQQLSYGLCFAYARASRAVSIPAPVYYADLVCRRGKFHFDDRVSVDADYSSDTSGTFNMSFWQEHFTEINFGMKNKMYFV
ncbi:Piwi-domain-containing protein [Neolentinus lepideus HHB14362 ss-1]|uniref:Piwi-domain-containing protein n=1 Tax=Neolentinus lepideus HHB14362 ss-1 TaxID=1314782 RepID=A0A165U5P8_9AGAM|nr:Piwi-domain-containing protein [Neolentinus lepideus HHB14362 ss-1]